MFLGDNLRRYSDLIIDNVFRYAFENSLPRPIISDVKTEWIGEIFNTSNIENDIHCDVIEDLKTIGLYDKIVKNTDKFVILPDVFSNNPIPITFERNEYDTDRRNIVIVNNKVFELFQHGKTVYYYNHNGKFYYFYKEAEMTGLFGNITPGNNNFVSALYINDYGWASDKVNDEFIEKWKSENELKLWINKDNKMSDDPDDVILKDNPGSTTRPDLAGLVFSYPFIELDYSNLSMDEFPEIPGHRSFGWRDMGMRPKWFNMEYNRYNIYDPDSIMATTAVVLLKDGSYHVDNLYANPKGKYVERVGKHNIEVRKNKNIKKVFMFIKPYDKTKFVKPDTTYYEALNKNQRAGKHMRKYACSTDKLYEFLLKNRCMCVDDIIKYGYEFDLDVLKVIQNTFPHITDLDMNNIKLSKYYGVIDKKVYKTSNISLNTELITELNKVLKSILDLSIRSLKNNSIYFIANDLINYIDKLKASNKLGLEDAKYSNKFKGKIDTLIDLITPYTFYADQTEAIELHDKLYLIFSKFDQLFNIDIEDLVKDKYSKIYEVYEKPKFMFNVWNPLQKYPALFIGNRLYHQDYKILKNDDTDILVVNPKDLLRMFYTENELTRLENTFKPVRVTSNGTDLNEDGTLKPYVSTNGVDKDPWDNLEWIENLTRPIFKKHKPKIIFTDYPYNLINKNGVTYTSKQSAKLCRDLYKDTVFCLDKYSAGFTKSNLQGTTFVQGYHSLDFPSDWGRSYSLPINDGYKLGPWYKVWDFKSNVQYYGNIRIWMGEPMFYQVPAYGENEQVVLQSLETQLRRGYRYITFDKQGIECTNKINVLSNEYIDMNYAPNIEEEGLKERACISIYEPSLKDFMFNYDLEIDDSKIGSENVGLFNNRVMKVKQIVNLFDPHDTWENTPSVVTKKTDYTIDINLNEYDFLDPADYEKVRVIKEKNITTPVFDRYKDVVKEIETSNYLAGHYIDHYDSRVDSYIQSDKVPVSETIWVDQNMDIEHEITDTSYIDAVVEDDNNFIRINEIMNKYIKDNNYTLVFKTNDNVHHIVFIPDNYFYITNMDLFNKVSRKRLNDIFNDNKNAILNKLASMFSSPRFKLSYEKIIYLENLTISEAELNNKIAEFNRILNSRDFRSASTNEFYKDTVFNYNEVFKLADNATLKSNNKLWLKEAYDVYVLFRDNPDDFNLEYPSRLTNMLRDVFENVYVYDNEDWMDNQYDLQGIINIMASYYRYDQSTSVNNIINDYVGNKSREYYSNINDKLYDIHTIIKEVK